MSDLFRKYADHYHPIACKNPPPQRKKSKYVVCQAVFATFVSTFHGCGGKCA